MWFENVRDGTTSIAADTVKRHKTAPKLDCDLQTAVIE
jgi:hypothetical protein